MERRFLFGVGFVFLAGVIAYGSWIARKIISDPDLIFLQAPAGPAKWIIPAQPFSLQAYDGGQVVRAFRTTVQVPSGLKEIVLHLRVLKRCDIHIDGKVVWSSGSDTTRWKAGHDITLTEQLPPGPHEISFYVANVTGPAAIWAYAPAIGLHTDNRWQGTTNGVDWGGTRLADERILSSFSTDFERADLALLSRLPLFLAVFVVVAALSHWSHRKGNSPSGWCTPGRLRWGLIVLWLAIGLNNIAKLPAAAGCDAPQHLQYMAFLLDQHRLPLATDGWQMFQSPLYYVLSAPLLFLLAKLTTIATATMWVRLIPVVCGVLQIELGYRALRYAMPSRPDLQALGVIVAGFLPVNIYSSQFTGNEPLAGCLGSAVVVLCFRLLSHPVAPTRSKLAVIGILFGLALLTKVSAVMLAVPLGGALGLDALVRSEAWRTGVRRFAIHSVWIVGIAAVLAGWYYVRNWIQLGRPFVGGWDNTRGIAWWQDPGYRTFSDFTQFGLVFLRPIYVSSVSLWDGIYASFWCDTFVGSGIIAATRPSWNYGFLLSSVWLAIIPSVALVLGFLRALTRWPVSTEDRIQWLSAIAIVSFGFVFFHHFLTIPYYAVVKASYSLVLMPCYVVVAALGFEVLTRWPLARSLLHGALATWAFSVGCAYFVR